MSYTLTYETSKSSQEFTAVKSVTMEIVDHADVYEMRQAFNEFLAATGYTYAAVSEGDDE